MFPSRQLGGPAVTAQGPQPVPGGDLEGGGVGRLRKEGVCITRASLVPQLVKDLPAVRETWVRPLGGEGPLEKGSATCSSIQASLVAQLVKDPPAVRETWLRSLGWEAPWEKGLLYPLQYSGLENPMDCSSRGHKESDTT